jgi:hypothetical protein
VIDTPPNTVGTGDKVTDEVLSVLIKVLVGAHVMVCAARGVTAEPAVTEAPSPDEFTARTRTVYAVPLFKDEIVLVPAVAEPKLTHAEPSNEYS